MGSFVSLTYSVVLPAKQKSLTKASKKWNDDVVTSKVFTNFFFVTNLSQVIITLIGVNQIS